MLPLAHLVAMEYSRETVLAADSAEVTQSQRPSANPVTRRACDPCFVHKEKCVYSGPRAECDRCRRLSKACVFNRPVRRAGRRRLLPLPRESSVFNTRGTQSKVPLVLHPFGVLFKDLQPAEEMMVRNLLDPSQFTILMVIPRVGPQLHQQAVYSFLRYYDEIHDAVFAMYGAFASALSIALPNYDPEANLRRGTLALKKFRGFPCPKDREDFEAWLWLGTCIIIHGRCALGSTASPVRRYMLSCLNELGEQGRHFKSHSVIVLLTALDIYDCLLHRQLPVMNMPESDLVGNDSFLGLCSPLVRFMYELCTINYCTVVPSGEDSGLDGHSENALRELEMSVEAWQPDAPSQYISQISTMEARHVLTQAHVHKTTILLFIYKLRYPFGVQDAPAKRMAGSIFSDLDLTTCTTEKAPDMVTLPFLIAAAEATEPSERDKIRNDVAIYVDGLSPKARDMIREFLEALWEMRDRLPGFRWMDMMAYLPPICVSM